MRLDLGCGSAPTGDVNVDLYPTDIGHRTGVKGKYGFNIPKCANFTQWDLNRYPLPFESNSFDEVFSAHTIEHLDNPFEFLKECVRISSDRIIIVCPHGLGERLTRRGKNPFHKTYFKRSWFKQAADAIGNLSIQGIISQYKGFPTKFGPLQIPFEIREEFRKC